MPASTSTTLKIWGRAERKVANTGAAGALTVDVRQGAFYYASGTAGDALTFVDVGAPVYASDDNTVNKTDGGATRSLAGFLLNVRADGQVAIQVGSKSPYV